MRAAPRSGGPSRTCSPARAGARRRRGSTSPARRRPRPATRRCRSRSGRTSSARHPFHQTDGWFASVRPQMTVVSLEEAVELVPDGSSIGTGGILMTRKPVALLNAVASVRRDLTLWTLLGSVDAELLTLHGALATANTIYVGFEQLGFAPAYSKAVADGSVNAREYSELLMLAGLRASLAGLPFLPTRGAQGSDVATALRIETITCPYTRRDAVRRARDPARRRARPRRGRRRARQRGRPRAPRLPVRLGREHRPRLDARDRQRRADRGRGHRRAAVRARGRRDRRAARRRAADGAARRVPADLGASAPTCAARALV